MVVQSHSAVFYIHGYRLRLIRSGLTLATSLYSRPDYSFHLLLAANSVLSSPLKTVPKRSPQWWVCMPLLMVVFICFTGCVRRRMTIRSNPVGALVYVDDYEIGTTPISVNFTNYGTRKIRVVKEGYETLTVMQPIPTPWYEIPPLDFFSENLVPGEIRDRRNLFYQLRPQLVVPDDQLRARAEELRARGQLPLAMAPPAYSSLPVGVPPSDAAPTGSFETIPIPRAEPMMPSQPMDRFPPNAQPLNSAQPRGATDYSTSGSTVPPYQAPGAWQPPPAPRGYSR